MTLSPSVNHFIYEDALSPDKGDLVGHSEIIAELGKHMRRHATLVTGSLRLVAGCDHAYLIGDWDTIDLLEHVLVGLRHARQVDDEAPRISYAPNAHPFYLREGGRELRENGMLHT